MTWIVLRHLQGRDTFEDETFMSRLTFDLLAFVNRKKSFQAWNKSSHVFSWKRNFGLLQWFVWFVFRSNVRSRLTASIIRKLEKLWKAHVTLNLPHTIYTWFQFRRRVQEKLIHHECHINPILLHKRWFAFAILTPLISPHEKSF